MRSVRGRRSVDERGQVTTALVMVVILGLTAVATLGVFALARGVDDRSRAQTAADAAALAGAGVLGDALPEILGLLDAKDGDLASYVGCDLGRADAEEYAAANDATLTAYCFDLASGEVTVEVRMQDPVSDDTGPAEAGAVASTGLDLGSCLFEDDAVEVQPSPTSTPTPEGGDGGGQGGGGQGGGGQGGDQGGDGADTPPPPPPDLGTTLDCGPLSAQFTIGGEDGRLSLESVDVGDLEPELVG